MSKKIILKSCKTEKRHLPARFSSLTPDANTITASQFPCDWHLYPTGIVYKFVAKKLPNGRKREIDYAFNPYVTRHLTKISCT